MTLAIMAGAVLAVLLAIAGLAEFATHSAERREVGIAARQGSETEVTRGSGIARLSRWFNRTRIGRWLEHELTMAGFRYPPIVVFVIFLVVTVTVPYVLARLLAPLFGVVGLVGGYVLLRTWLKRARERRREKFVQQIPELARILSNATNAGLSIATAWAVAEAEMAEPARSEIQRLNSAVRFGAPLEEAMLQLNDRLPSREVRVLMSTMVVSARSGGSLVKALRDISFTLDDRKEVRREVRTTLAQARSTSVLVAVLGRRDPADAEHDPARDGRADDPEHRRADRAGGRLRPVRHRLPGHPADDEGGAVMNQFSTLWPALGATGALLVFLLGLRMARTSPRDYLDAADLILLQEERRREARLSPVNRLAGRFAPRLRRLIGTAGVRYLQQLIDTAGPTRRRQRRQPVAVGLLVGPAARPGRRAVHPPGSAAGGG